MTQTASRRRTWPALLLSTWLLAGSGLAAVAMGANILGSVLGGWVEYGTMVVGIRGLLLVAAGFYGLSWVMLVLARRRGSEGGDR